MIRFASCYVVAMILDWFFDRKIISPNNKKDSNTLMAFNFECVSVSFVWRMDLAFTKRAKSWLRQYIKMAKIIDGRRGGKVLTYYWYIYQRNKTTQDLTYRRCANSNCRVSIKTDAFDLRDPADEFEVYDINDHHHMPEDQTSHPWWPFCSTEKHLWRFYCCCEETRKYSSRGHPFVHQCSKPVKAREKQERPPYTGWYRRCCH